MATTKLFSVSWACSALAISLVAADTPEVRTDSGMVRGSMAQNVSSFKGIPFAAPPAGENRWRSPQPVKAWSGVRDATKYGADCMQLPFPGDAAPLGVKPAEDCLYMNVWRPVEASPSKPMPVMVWIYGGGFVNGGSSPAVYDGSAFAERGIVFVSFNYRLGRFGFFAHPALTAQDPDGMLGNYGYMDQIAALQWVKRNIRAFGGDPAKVTIFGESAGGGSVLMLLTSPLARGLFDKAVIESGGGRTTLMAPRSVRESKKGLPSGEGVGVKFAQDAGISGTDAAALKALRSLPAERVVNGLNMATMMTPTYAGPMIDGKVVVEAPADAFAAGRQSRVPVMAGANSSDIGFSTAKNFDELYAPFGAKKSGAEAAYNSANSTDLKAVSAMLAADTMMVEPARFLVRAATAAGQPAYEYRFSYVAESMRNEWKGAPHATEIPFVFDTVKARYGQKLAATDEKIAQQMNEYWISFAKTGDPNGSGRPDWPLYNAQADQIMNFTNEGPVAQPDAWKARLDLVEGLSQTQP